MKILITTLLLLCAVYAQSTMDLNDTVHYDFRDTNSSAMDRPNIIEK